MQTGTSLAVSLWPAAEPSFWMRLPKSFQPSRSNCCACCRSAPTSRWGLIIGIYRCPVIVATNKDLSEWVRTGLFREDLYYRVNVVRVELPPLRRRKEDIPLLINQFITRFNRLQQKTVQGIAHEALSLLMAHHWPGNIRELENIIERAFILCREGYIGIKHLPEELAGHTVSGQNDSNVRSVHDVLDVQAIRATLERTGFNRLEAAKELGIHKTTLFRRMKKLGIGFRNEMVVLVRSSKGSYT